MDAPGAAYYESILNDDQKLTAVIREEALAVKERHKDARRTEIAQSAEDINLDDIIQVEDMIVTMTHFGYVKRLTPDTYRTQRRGGRGIKGQGTREEYFVERILLSSTHAPILFFTNLGRTYQIKCYAIPEAGRTSKGTPIVNLLQLQTGEKVTAMIPLPKNIDENSFLIMATKKGIIKKTPMDAYSNIRKNGLIAQNLREGDELIAVELSSGTDEFLVATKKGRGVRFSETDVRAMGRNATGVRAVKLIGDDELVDMVKIDPEATVLTVSERGKGKRTRTDEFTVHKRGGSGMKVMELTEKTGDLTCLKMVLGDEDLMLIRDDGFIIRMPVDQIRIAGRSTQGVQLIRVDDMSKVVSVAVVPHREEEEEPQEDAESPVEQSEPSNE